MSDNQNPAPHDGNATPTPPEAVPGAAANETSAAPPVPPAPKYDAPSAPAYDTPAPEAPPAPAYGAPEIPAAPAYGAPAAPAAPAYGAPAHNAAPAYGTPAYGAAPAYGTPAYGAPSPYGAAPYGAGYGSTVRTNVLAIISLVASIAGFIGVVPFIGPIAGVITGHISLAQIKRTGENGRGMALAGTIIGWVGIGVAILLIIFFIVFVGVAASQSSRYGA